MSPMPCERSEKPPNTRFRIPKTFAIVGFDPRRCGAAYFESCGGENGLLDSGIDPKGWLMQLTLLERIGC